MAKQAHLQAILSAVDRLTPVLRGITGSAMATRVGLSSLNTVSFAAAQRKLGMLHKTFRDVGSASRNLLGGLGLPASIGLGAIGFGLVAAGRGALEYAGALQDAKDNTGLAGGAFQEFQLLMEAGGVSAEDFTGAVTKLNKGIGEAAVGKDKGLLGLMNKLRIPLRDAKGAIRGVEQILPELSDAFEKNKNPAVRTRMAMELFGKSGAKLIAILMQGGASMATARKEAQRLGAVLSEESTGALDDVGDAFGVLNRQVKVQTAEAFGVAAPAILAATKGLQEWIAKNKDLIQQKVGGYITTVANAFKTWVESGGIERLALGIENVVDGIGDFVEKVGGLQNVLIGIGALILAGPVASLVSLGAALARVGLLFAGPLLTGLAALWTSLAAGQVVFAGMTVSVGALVVAALPFIAVAAAIAGAAYLIYRNWDGIAEFFTSLWATVTTKAGEVWVDLKAVFTAGLALVDGILSGWSPLAIIVKSWSPVLSFLGDIWTKVRGIVSSITSAGSSLSAAESVGGGYDAMGNPTGAPMLSGSTPLARAGALQQPTARVQGDMKVSFVNAPAGMRVEDSGTNAPGFGMQSRVDYGVRGGGIG